MRITIFVGFTFAAGLSAACNSRLEFLCTQSAACDLGGGGLCATAGTGNHWCAYPDPDCPSGYRYSTQDVGDGLGGMCVSDDGHADDGGMDSDDGGHTGLRMWGPPAGVANVNSTTDEYEPVISANGLELYFWTSSLNPPYGEIFVATRSTTNSAFSGPMNLSAVNSTNGNENGVLPAHSGLELFILRGSSLMTSTRVNAASAWSTPAAAPFTMQALAGLSEDDLTLYFVKRCDAAHHNGNGPCLYQMDRPAVGQPWAVPTVIEWPGGATQWGYAFVSNDGLRVLLSAPYSGTSVRAAQSQRPDTSSPWPDPQIIDALSLETTNGYLSWNDSETEIYLTSNPVDSLVGGFDIYVSVPR